MKFLTIENNEVREIKLSHIYFKKVHDQDIVQYEAFFNDNKDIDTLLCINGVVFNQVTRRDESFPKEFCSDVISLLKTDNDKGFYLLFVEYLKNEFKNFFGETKVFKVCEYRNNNKIVRKKREYTKINGTQTWVNIKEEDYGYTKETVFTYALQINDKVLYNNIYNGRYFNNEIYKALKESDKQTFLDMYNDKDYFFKNIDIETYRDLGMDVSVMVESRERQLREKEERSAQFLREREENARKLELEREEKEKNRIKSLIKDFVCDNGSVDNEDFITIANFLGVKLHMRTVGMIRKRLDLIYNDGGYTYTKIRRTRDPKPSLVFNESVQEVFEACKEFLK